MFVTNVSRGPVSLDGVRTLKPTDRRIYYEDTADNIARAMRMVKAKQISVGFDDSLLAIASEPITANSMMNIIENEDGVLYCRRASDASAETVAHGFADAAFPVGEVVRVYLEGFIVFNNNLDKNRVYYLGAGPGSITTTEPTALNKIRQVIGVAITTDLLLFMNNGYEMVTGSGAPVPGANINVKFRKYKKVLTSDNDRTLTLAAPPADQSENIYWNGVLVDDYALNGNIATLDASLKTSQGDTFIVKYVTIEATEPVT